MVAFDSNATVVDVYAQTFVAFLFAHVGAPGTDSVVIAIGVTPEANTLLRAKLFGKHHVTASVSLARAKSSLSVSPSELTICPFFVAGSGRRSAGLGASIQAPASFAA